MLTPNGITDFDEYGVDANGNTVVAAIGVGGVLDMPIAILFRLDASLNAIDGKIGGCNSLLTRSLTYVEYGVEYALYGLIRIIGESSPETYTKSH